MCPLPGGDCNSPRILFLAAPRPNCTLNASHSHSPSHTQSQNCCPHKHNVSAALIGSWPLYTGDLDQWEASLQAVALVDGWAACTGTGRCGAGCGHSGPGPRAHTRHSRPGPPVTRHCCICMFPLSPLSHQHPTNAKNVRSSPIVQQFYSTTKRHSDCNIKMINNCQKFRNGTLQFLDKCRVLN